MKHLTSVQSMMSRASLRTISNPVSSKFYNNGAEQALIATLSPVGLVEKMKTDLGKGLIESVKDFAD
jgi:hypothetical protein